MQKQAEKAEKQSGNKPSKKQPEFFRSTVPNLFRRANGIFYGWVKIYGKIYKKSFGMVSLNLTDGHYPLSINDVTTASWYCACACIVADNQDFPAELHESMSANFVTETCMGSAPARGMGTVQQSFSLDPSKSSSGRRALVSFASSRNPAQRHHHLLETVESIAGMREPPRGLVLTPT